MKKGIATFQSKCYICIAVPDRYVVCRYVHMQAYPPNKPYCIASVTNLHIFRGKYIPMLLIYIFHVYSQYVMYIKCQTISMEKSNSKYTILQCHSNELEVNSLKQSRPLQSDSTKLSYKSHSSVARGTKVGIMPRTPPTKRRQIICETEKLFDKFYIYYY